ncbi:ATP-binding protein [Aliidiomarina minuta]|uniref:ATP-binding protein n=1 Tax=Aliidiomarina minuta TaxID=880057 RepID=A0A432W3N1_9GAMM|nr:ATP-binding protein [Aliidiomarina minuta]RUO23970.1 ATP-binding protein [Aliidiomarina minuta]
MSQLLRIIMINGHMPGIVELALDGHSNICGTNASGKTTLQRMVPVFYGEQPNRVVPKTRDRFDVYYLPYQNSYVVYEYSRANGDRAQVVLTKGSDGVDYRFVDAPYAPEQYLQEELEGVRAVSYADWGQALRRANIDSSHKIGATSEYRSIIQNDIAAMRGNRKDGIKLRQLAARYALVQSPQRLRHIEKLVSAVHAKEGKMDTLKSMLATILEEDGHKRPENTFKPARIRTWIQEMRQYMNQEELQKQFSVVQQTASDVEDNLAILWQLKPLLEQDLGEQKQARADAEQSLQQCTHKLNDSEAEYKIQQRQANDELAEVKAELSQLQSRLDDLQDRYEKYQERDMDGLQRDTEKLSLWREELLELGEQYKLMMEKHDDAQRKLDEHKMKLQDALQRLQSKNQQRIHAIRQQQDEVRDRQQTTLSELQQEYQQQLDAQHAEFQNQLQEVSAQLAAVKTQLQLSPLTSAEQEEVVQVDARMEEAQQQLNLSNSAVERAQREFEQSRQQRVQKDSDLTQARQALHQVEKEQTELRKQLNPTPGSLRHFLRQHYEGWEHNLGKVIAEPLLQRQDLAPELDPGREKNLFGLELDLGAIESPEYARDESWMIEQLESVEQRLESASQHKELQQKELAQASQQVSEQEQKLHQLQQQKRHVEQDLEFARDAKQRLLAAQRELVKERHAELAKTQQQYEQKQADLQQQRSEVLATIRHQQKEQELEYKATFQDELQRLQEQLADLELQIETKLNANKETLNELEKAFAEQLASEGVDSKRLQNLKAQIQQHKEQIHQIESRQQELTEYRDFMRIDWQHNRPRWMQQEQQAKKAELEKTQQLEQLKSEFAAQEKQLLQQQKHYKQQMQDATVKVQDLSLLVQRLADLRLSEAATDNTISTLDLSERLGRAHAALEQQGKLQRALKEQVDNFESLVRREASTDFLQLMDREYAGLGEQPNEQQRIEALQALLKILQDQQLQIVDQGKNIGGALEKFFIVFDDINRRVGQYSRRLTEVVGDELNLEGINRSEVKISSTIDELGFWQPLKNLTRLFRSWNESGALLPDKDYLDTLSDVAELLRADQEYSLESLLKLELHLNERGSELVIRNDRQLLESSSHGMAYLILCKFLLAFTRLLRGESDVVVHWPIDEIGTLAYHNVEKLFAACDSNNIQIVGAFPNPESDVLMLFKHRYLIEPHPEQPGKGQLKRIQPRISRLSEKLQQKAAQAEVSA